MTRFLSISYARPRMTRLRLKRPIVFLDLETTGTTPLSDRIVELAMVKIRPDGQRETYHTLVNPQIPIPETASRIHGIYDDDVKAKPVFRDLAQSVLEFLGGADLGGFNVIRFDLPLLTEEFKRAGVSWSPSEEAVLDAQVIFHKKEPRTLEAAVRYYCNREHEGAHSALADVEATIEVLEGQLSRYEDLPAEVPRLGLYCDQKNPDYVDRFGKFVWCNGEACLNFGPHRGKPLREVLEKDPNFLEWILRKDFSAEVKTIVAEAMLGNFPVRPGEGSPEEAPPQDEGRHETNERGERQPSLW